MGCMQVFFSKFLMGGGTHFFFFPKKMGGGGLTKNFPLKATFGLEEAILKRIFQALAIVI